MAGPPPPPPPPPAPPRPDAAGGAAPHVNNTTVIFRPSVRIDVRFGRDEEATPAPPPSQGVEQEEEDEEEGPPPQPSQGVEQHPEAAGHPRAHRPWPSSDPADPSFTLWANAMMGGALTLAAAICADADDRWARAAAVVAARRARAEAAARRARGWPVLPPRRGVAAARAAPPP